MEKAVFVHVSEAEHCLVQYTFDFVLRESRLALLHELVNILLHKFEHEVKVVIYPDYFFELDNLSVVEFAEGLNFAESHALFPGVKLLLHLFNGNFLL